MKKIITAIAAVSTAAAFTSCQPQNYAQANAGTGSVIGAALGGIIGHQSGKGLEGAAIGGAVGGAGGYMIGNEKDKKQQ